MTRSKHHPAILDADLAAKRPHPPPDPNDKHRYVNYLVPAFPIGLLTGLAGSLHLFISGIGFRALQPLFIESAWNELVVYIYCAGRAASLCFCVKWETGSEKN